MNNPNNVGFWKVFDVEFPHDFEKYYCDRDTAEYIAHLETLSDKEYACREYTAEPLETD